MNRLEKEQAIASLEEKFKSSEAVLVTEYRGLSVTEIKELRVSLGQDNTYSVVKNTLASIAAKKAEVNETIREYLTGPTALVFVSNDPAKASKSLKKFASDNEKLVIKAGLLDGQVLSTDEIKALAELPSKEELIGSVINTLLNPVSEVVNGLAGNLHGLLDGIEAKAK